MVSLKNIFLIIGLASVVFIAIFVNITRLYYPTDDVKKQEIALTSFSHACNFDEAVKQVMCRGAELSKVLDERAKNPQFKIFNDAKANVSFEYPSSVALVGKEVTPTSLLYMIYPRIPATINSDFWKGMQIFIEPCTQACLSSIESKIKSKYSFGKGSKIETATSTTRIAGIDWTVSKLYNSLGKMTTVYSTYDNKNLIIVGTDTETISANISIAFKRVLETLKYERR